MNFIAISNFIGTIFHKVGWLMTGCVLPLHPQAPDNEEWFWPRAHAVGNVCWIAYQTAQAWCVPRIVVLTPIPITQNHIEFFWRMIMVGKFDFRLEKRDADNHIRSLLKSVGTDNEYIGVTAHKIRQV